MKIPYKWLLFGPVMVFALGYLMNDVAIFANNGQMPVLAPGGNCGLVTGGNDFIHSCMNAHTHLKFLCDWIFDNELKAMQSPGDWLEQLCDYTFKPALVVWGALMTWDWNKTVAHGFFQIR